MIKDGKVVIFGFGDFGKRAADFFGDNNVLAFADNDKKKHGKSYCGKKVISPESLLKIYDQERFKIVIANEKYSEDIKTQLIEMGCKDYVIYRPEYSDIKRGLEKAFGDIVLILDDVEYEQYSDLKYFIDLMQKNKTIKIFSYSQYEKWVNRKIDDNLYLYSKYHHAALRNALSASNRHVTDILFDILWSDRNIIHIPSEENWVHGLDDDNWMKQIKDNHMVEMTNEYMHSLATINKIPLFKIVEIETINRCNSNCSFCPSNVNALQPERCYMEDELLHRLIGQLKEIDYDGQIELYSANEPFLDSQIIERYRYARKELPHAKLTILSNGLLLDLQKYLDIIDYVDEFIINNYSTERKLHNNLEEIVDYCRKNPEKRYIDKTKIYIRRIDEVLSSRGGTAPNKTEGYDFSNCGCALPFLEIIIGSSGMVKMCSQDPFCKHSVGDANKEKLVDIWYSERLNAVRKKLFSGRRNIDLCSNCDFFYIQ